MVRIRISLCAIATGVVVALMLAWTAMGEITREGLVAEYHFDGDAKDSSGNGNDGVIYGAKFVDGKCGKALSFDGVDDYVVTSQTIPISGSSKRTLEFWAKVNSITVHPHLIGWGSQTQLNTAFKAVILAPTAGSGTWLLWGRGYYNDWDTGIQVNTGIWLHHVITYDGVKAEWFINGSSLGTFTHTYSTTATTLEIGLGTTEGNPFSGTIDEVRIYNRALNADEIKANYEAYKTPTPTPTPTPATPTPPPVTPRPTPTPPLLPISPEYLYVIPIALFLFLLPLIFYIRGKRKKSAITFPEKPSPTPEQKVKEEQISLPISKPITIERAIYDPCKRDFIAPRPLTRMKEWINNSDPNAYWFAIAIQNNTDKSIEEWDVDLEMSAALKVSEAKIEGIEREIPHEAHLKLFKISVPKEYGIVIPKGGAQRVYFKLRAEKPKTLYEISGVFKSAISGDVLIRAKEFKYLCDAGVSPEAVKAELKKTFSEKDAARLANAFRIAQEIRSGYCNTDITAREMNKEFDLLKMYLDEKEFLDEIGGIQRRINAELREDERLDAKHVEEVKDFCEKFTEMWIAKFLR